MRPKIFKYPNGTEDPGIETALPDHLKNDHSFGWTSKRCIRYSFGLLVLNEFQHPHFNMTMFHWEVKEGSQFWVTFDQAAIALTIFLRGSVMNKQDTFNYEFGAQKYCLSYISEERALIVLPESETDVIIITLTPEYLTELTEAWPRQKLLMDALNDPCVSQCPFPLSDLNTRVRKHLSTIRNSQKNDHLLLMQLKSCITVILEEYLNSIDEGRLTGDSLKALHEEKLISIYQQIREMAIYHTRDIAGFANACNLGERTLRRHFTSYYGFNLRTLVWETRMQHAYKLVTETNMALKEISFKLRYEHYSSFQKDFMKEYKVSPRSFR